MFIPLVQQTFRMQITDQEAAIQRNWTQILEAVDLQKKNDINITAAQKAVTELEEAETKTNLEAQKKKMQIAAQKHTIERQLLENMEAEEKINRLTSMIEDAKRAKNDYETKLKLSIDAHGDQRWPIKE